MCGTKAGILTTPIGETINRHEEIINAQGSVWWGWWAKPDEKVSGEFLRIQGKLPSGALNIFLFDSGQSKLYVAELIRIELNASTLACPDTDKSPGYYAEQRYNVWFEFASISEVDEKTIKDYAYSDKIKDFFNDPQMFSIFENKQISSLRELRLQDRTVWFLENYDRTIHDSHEILLSTANDSVAAVFPKRTVELRNGKVIWMSDIHFDEDKSKHQFDQDNQLGLSEILIGKHELEIDGMIISGDITWKATSKEFELTADFFSAICSVKRVKIDAIGFCPGNHDVSFSENIPKEVATALDDYHEAQMGRKEISKVNWDILAATDVTEESKKNYQVFFKSIVGTEPNDYLSMGKRYLIRNQKIVDFCFLNSNHLQQHKVAFQGQGFVGIKQLNDAAKQMQWEGNDKIPGGFRVVVLHHNLYPVNYSSEPYVSVPASLVYDTEAILKWCFKHGVDLILHGHTHERYITKVSKKISNSTKKIWMVGLGSSGVITSHLVGCNEFAEIDFNNEVIRINFYNIRDNEIEDQPEIVDLD